MNRNHFTGIVACIALASCTNGVTMLPTSPLANASASLNAGQCYERRENIGEHRLYRGKASPVDIVAPRQDKFSALSVVNELSSPVLVWAGRDKGSAKFIAPRTSAWWSIAPSRIVHVQQTLDQPSPGLVHISLSSCGLGMRS